MTPFERSLADRLRLAPWGAARAAVIRGWLACVGQRVRPGPPALDHWARGRWEDRRIAELGEQLEEIRDRLAGLDDGP